MDSKYNKENRFHCLDKEIGHHSVYLKNVYAVDFKCEYGEKSGSLVEWNLIGRTSHKGNTVEEFIDCLKTLIKFYDLKDYSEGCFYKDQIMIYTTNVAKIYAFCKKYATDVFGGSLATNMRQFTLLDYFVISECGPWTGETEVNTIYHSMQNIMNNIFIPNKRVYLSPYQMNRKKVKSMKLTAPVPKNPADFDFWRKSYYGGCAYAKREIDYFKHIMEYDRKSAYLYEYFMPHMTSLPKKISVDRWPEWIDNGNVNRSIGVYEITFIMKHRFINVYNQTPSKWKLNQTYTVKLNLLDIDLRIFLQCAEIIKITCKALYEYEVSMLPKLIINHIVQCFLDKEEKGGIYKTIANANYGSLCMDLSDDKVKELKKNPYYSPMWGYEIASYARKHLFEIGSKLDGWLYSDTDSIYCLYSLENKVKIEEYNDFMQKVVKLACEEYDLDFESIKNIGLFKFETGIKDMVIRGIKTYAYTTDDGKFVVKAAGMSEDGTHDKKTWYDFDKDLNYGNKIIGHVEDGYYYEEVLNMRFTAELDMTNEEILTLLTYRQ